MFSAKKLFFAAAAVTAFLAVAQASPLTERDLTCPDNSSPNASGKACVCNDGYYSGGTNGDGSLKRCWPVCSANYYPVLTSSGYATGACAKCPTYSTSSGRTSSCTCDADYPRVSTTAAGQTAQCKCPANSALVSGSCQCSSGYYSAGTTAAGALKRCYPVCATNQYPELTNDGWATGNCIACPKYSTSTGAVFQCTCQATNPVLRTTAAGQTAECGCPSNASKVNGECKCDAGFKSGGTNGNGSLARCYPICAANEFPNVDNKSNPTGGCSACPANASSDGTTKSCTCDSGYKTSTTNAAGQVNKCVVNPAAAL